MNDFRPFADNEKRRTHHRIWLLTPARGRGWVRGMRTSLPPHLASPPSGGEEFEMCPHRRAKLGEVARRAGGVRGRLSFRPLRLRAYGRSSTSPLRGEDN